MRQTDPDWRLNLHEIASEVDSIPYVLKHIVYRVRSHTVMARGQWLSYHILDLRWLAVAINNMNWHIYKSFRTCISGGYQYIQESGYIGCHTSNRIFIRGSTLPNAASCRSNVIHTLHCFLRQSAKPDITDIRFKLFQNMILKSGIHSLLATRWQIVQTYIIHGVAGANKCSTKIRNQ